MAFTFFWNGPKVLEDFISPGRKFQTDYPLLAKQFWSFLDFSLGGLKLRLEKMMNFGKQQNLSNSKNFDEDIIPKGGPVNDLQLLLPLRVHKLQTNGLAPFYEATKGSSPLPMALSFPLGCAYRISF